MKSSTFELSHRWSLRASRTRTIRRTIGALQVGSHATANQFSLLLWADFLCWYFVAYVYVRARNDLHSAGGHHMQIS